MGSPYKLRRAIFIDAVRAGGNHQHRTTAVHGPEDDRFRNLRDRAADGRRRFRRGAHASIKFENQVPITERSLHAQRGRGHGRFHDVFSDEASRRRYHALHRT